MIQQYPFYNWLRVEPEQTPEFADCCGKCGNVPLPVCFGSDLAFALIFDGQYYNIDTDGAVSYETADCAFIQSAQNITFDENHNFAQLNDDLSEIFAPGDCFRLKVADASGDYSYFSNLFIYIGCNTENTLLFEYWDDADSDAHLKIRLYALASKEQTKTDKEEYESINGEVITLSKKRRKEYELQFYYYPDHIHDSIREMLIFPNILIDEIPMYESGDYEVDRDNPNENGNVTAATKVSRQDIIQYGMC